jgi:predicted site-specific integrase-resolvase
LRNWDIRGELKPVNVSQGGARYYSEEQRNQFLGIAGRKKSKRITIGYCRVSLNKQKDDLER